MTEMLVPFGDDRLVLPFPPAVSPGWYPPSSGPHGGWQEGWRRTLRAQVRRFARPGIAIVINDATRPTPSKMLLGEIADIIPADAAFFVATGLHRRPSTEELAKLIPAVLLDRTLVPHDATGRLRSCGTTRRGTPVDVSAELVRRHRVLLLGSVEPHYFAGFTGGRKGIVPGLAGERTILANHRWALDPAAAPLALDGNPVHEDLVEAVGIVRKKEDLQILHASSVIDSAGGMAGFSVGSLEKAFSATVAVSRRVHTVPLAAPLDLAVAVAAPPLSGDLFQAHKAVENVQGSVRDGGTLLWIAGTSKVGAGGWLRPLVEADGPGQVVAMGEEVRSGKRPYDFALHKAVRLARVMERVRVLTMSRVAWDDLEEAGLNPHDDPREAVLDALDGLGKSPRIGVFPQATMTVPVVAPSPRQSRKRKPLART